MSAQTILPFPQWQFPDADAQLLLLANSYDQKERYSYDWEHNWKRWWFYPLKSKILREHAVPDGFDVQVLTLACNRCIKGIWRSECGYHSDICWHCDGTGIFRVDAVKLSRWVLSERVFHIPEDRWRGIEEGELETLKAPANDSFQGLITHAGCDEKCGRRAFLKLLQKYDVDAYEELRERRLRENLRALEDRIKDPFRAMARRAYGWLQFSDSRWAEGLREWLGIEELPF